MGSQSEFNIASVLLARKNTDRITELYELLAMTTAALQRQNERIAALEYHLGLDR
jgi:hypothetical protein